MASSKDQVLTSQLDLEEDLTCSICLDLYHDPVSLPCQHNFCRKCIRSHLQQTSDTQVLVIGTQHERFPCPTCRDSVELTDADINNLPKNFGLQSIVFKFQSLKLENETRSNAIQETKCKHHGKPLMLYCDTCEEAMCIECIPIRSHENHTIVQFTEKVKSYQEYITQSLPYIIEFQETLQSRKNQLTSDHQGAQEMLQVHMKEVADIFQKLRTVVNQKELEIMYELESKKEEFDSQFKTRAESLNTRLEIFANLITKFSSVTFHDPVKTIQEIKSYEKSYHEESVEEYGENIIQALNMMKLPNQIERLNEDVKRLLSEINSIEIGRRGDIGAKTDISKSSAHCPSSRTENTDVAYSSTVDMNTQEKKLCSGKQHTPTCMSNEDVKEDVSSPKCKEQSPHVDSGDFYFLDLSTPLPSDTLKALYGKEETQSVTFPSAKPRKQKRKERKKAAVYFTTN